MAKQNKKQETARLANVLVLNRIMLSLFGVSKFDRNISLYKKIGAKLESRPYISEPKNLKPEVNGNILKTKIHTNLPFTKYLT